MSELIEKFQLSDPKDKAILWLSIDEIEETREALQLKADLETIQSMTWGATQISRGNCHSDAWVILIVDAEVGGGAIRTSKPKLAEAINAAAQAIRKGGD